jgi:hypothetical protein
MTTQPTNQVMAADAAADTANGITIGVTGQQARWTVAPWGAITPWGQENPVTFEWFIAADDRWHVPAHEPTVRQLRLEGTPVLETRVRIPDGDAVQRIWAVPDGGGSVIIEFENESPKPFAVAVAGPAIVTERPAADVPIQGIELPEGAIVLPVGHRATVRIAFSFPDAVGHPVSLNQAPPMLAVIRGWTRVTEQASRLVLPDESLVNAMVAARCDLLLEGPVDGAEDPVGFLLDVAELVRCGDSAEAWLLDVVEPAERLARRAGARGASPEAVADAFAGLAAARLVAVHAGDDRAAGDIDRTIAKVASKRDDLSVAVSAGVVTSFADLRRESSVGRFVRSVERRIVDGGRLLTGGMPTAWLGNNFEVHGLPTSPTSTVGFAVRWHGERPAMLWEQHGTADVELSAPDVDPGWTTSETSGETLWPAPEVERPKRAALSITVDPDGASFS